MSAGTSRVKDRVGIWLIALAALAMLNLGIPAFVGLVTGSGQ